MIRLDEQYLMMIEPVGAPTVPIVDTVTRIAAAVFAAATTKISTRGWHSCTGQGCSATSDNKIWMVDGRETNSLLIHYVACHRREIPTDEIVKLVAVADVICLVPTDPTADQMSGQLAVRLPANNPRAS